MKLKVNFVLTTQLIDVTLLSPHFDPSDKEEEKHILDNLTRIQEKLMINDDWYAYDMRYVP